MEFYIMLMIVGLMLIGAETFIPGGILGVFGAIALLVAMVIGFAIFPASIASLAALGTILLVGIVIWLWIKIFPNTWVGRKMTASADLDLADMTDEKLNALVGATGKARSTLRPAGFAEINGNKIDVVTEGEMIEAGTPIRVINVFGNRVVVEAASNENT